MILHRDGTGRRDDPGIGPSSVPEMARSLRQARAKLGLAIEDVSRQSGIPISDLQVLEAGTVDRIPDRVWTLKVLRRYADVLELPGDRYVLALVTHWPDDVANGKEPGSANGDEPAVTASLVTSVASSDPTGPTGTAVPTAATGAVVESSTGSQSSTTAVLDDLTDADETGVGTDPEERELARVRDHTAIDPHSDASYREEFNTGQVPLVDVDTGVTRAVRGAWRSRETLWPLLLRFFVLLTLTLVVVGGAWLAVNHWSPQWLKDVRLPYTSAQPAHAATLKTSATPTTAAPPSAQFAATSPTAATVTVNRPNFTLKVLAGKKTASLVVTGFLGKPVFSGAVRSGHSRTFHGGVQLNALIGSKGSKVVVVVYAGNKVVGFYSPPVRLYLLTINSSS